MSIRTALENLQKALDIAEAEQDEYRQLIALALIDIARAVRAVSTESRDIKAKVNRLD